MKKILFVFFVLVFSVSRSQIVYSDRFNSLSLQTYTNASGSTVYTTVPTSYTLINDTRGNNVGSINAPNRPFNVPALKTTGWALLYSAAENDTFLVSTSYIDSTLYSVDRWLILPAMTNVPANAVLSWDA